MSPKFQGCTPDCTSISDAFFFMIASLQVVLMPRLRFDTRQVHNEASPGRCSAGVGAHNGLVQTGLSRIRFCTASVEAHSCGR